MRQRLFDLGPVDGECSSDGGTTVPPDEEVRCAVDGSGGLGRSGAFGK